MLTIYPPHCIKTCFPSNVVNEVEEKVKIKQLKKKKVNEEKMKLKTLSTSDRMLSDFLK